VRPEYRKGLPVEWWAASGYCTRRSPSPATEDDRKVHRPVTNAADSCGDGAQVEADTVDTSDEVSALEAVQGGLNPGHCGGHWPGSQNPKLLAYSAV